MIVALRSSSDLVGCLRIIISSSLLFFIDIIWHKDSIGEGFKDFYNFLFFYEFVKIWSYYGWPEFVISAWTFRKLQMVFCGHIVV